MQPRQTKSIAEQIQEIVFMLPVENDHDTNPGFLAAVKLVYAAAKECQQKTCDNQTVKNLLILLTDAINSCRSEDPAFQNAQATIDQLMSQCAA